MTAGRRNAARTRIADCQETAILIAGKTTGARATAGTEAWPSLGVDGSVFDRVRVVLDVCEP